MEIFFNMNKIRFTILTELVNGACTTITKDSNINVYLNLEPILRRIISSDKDREFGLSINERVIEFISCVFNYAAHYKLFFAKNKLNCKVYMYLPYPFDSIFNNREINKEYRKNMSDMMTKNTKTTNLRKIINDGVPLLKTIIEYVDGVYFIDSQNIEPSVIPYMIYKDTPDDIHFLVSSDRYDYQYASYDNFFVLRPKANNSYILYKSNLIEQLKLEGKIKNDSTVNANMISFILSMLGDDIRTIPKIKRMGLSTIIKSIEKGVKNSLISDEVNNIFLLSKIIKDEHLEQVMNNYLCIDIKTQYDKLSSKDIYNFNQCIVDKFDNVQLKALNDQYFQLYPLYLLEIQSGLKHKKAEKIKF